MTLGAAAGAGFLLWLAAQFDRTTTGGYWAAYGVVAGCGVLLGAAQLRGTGGHPPAMALLALLPVLVCGGWILLFAQPDPNWFQRHVSAWSGDIGIRGVVDDVSTFLGVLAFGIGLVFAYALEPGLARRRPAVSEEARPVERPAAAPADTRVADEPTAAERAETARATEERRGWLRTRVRVR